MKSARSPRLRPEGSNPSAIEPAVVEEIGDRLRVRRASVASLRDVAHDDVVEATVARIPGYVPSVGDRVLVSFGRESFVIAVLAAAAPEALVLPDGARAEVSEGRLELRDARGRLLVRYEAGHAEIAAPSGDLRLAAPEGRVVIESALDVAVTSGRDVRVEAARRFEAATGTEASGTSLRLEPKRAALRTPAVEVTSKTARLATGRATLLARSIATTAEQLAQSVGEYELTAERLVEKTKDAFRDASDLAQTRAGRLRTIVKDVLSMNARRSVLVSTDETSIDGKKVLLG